MMDLLATGYPSLDYIMRVTHSPTIGETALIKTTADRFTFGGCGANVAVVMAAQGLQTGVAMIVGADAPGDEYLRFLATAGVNTDHVIRLSGERTSTGYLFINPDNEYQIFFLPGAADAWQGQLELKDVERYRLALLTVGPLHYNRQFVQQVQRAGVPLAWMLKPDVFAYPAEIVETFWSACCYLLMNHIEAQYVLRVMGYNDVRQLLHPQMRAIVVTAGAQGATVYTGDGEWQVPAVSPARLVDPTGAGDAFTAGFLAGVLHSVPPKTAMQWGVTLASFVIEAVGCQTNIPTPDQLQARYERIFST